MVALFSPFDSSFFFLKKRKEVPFLKKWYPKKQYLDSKYRFPILIFNSMQHWKSSSRRLISQNVRNSIWRIEEIFFNISKNVTLHYFLYLYSVWNKHNDLEKILQCMEKYLDFIVVRRVHRLLFGHATLMKCKNKNRNNMNVLKKPPTTCTYVLASLYSSF